MKDASTSDLFQVDVTVTSSSLLLGDPSPKGGSTCKKPRKKPNDKR